VHQHVANLFARSGAARFARDEDGEGVGAQGTRQLLDLRALAAAIETFEGNKFSAHGHVGDDSRQAGSQCPDAGAANRPGWLIY
jgi:hypothetical protein